MPNICYETVIREKQFLDRQNPLGLIKLEFYFDVIVIAHQAGFSIEVTHYILNEALLPSERSSGQAYESCA